MVSNIIPGETFAPKVDCRCNIVSDAISFDLDGEVSVCPRIAVRSDKHLAAPTKPFVHPFAHGTKHDGIYLVERMRPVEYDLLA